MAGGGRLVARGRRPPRVQPHCHRVVSFRRPPAAGHRRAPVHTARRGNRPGNPAASAPTLVAHVGAPMYLPAGPAAVAAHAPVLVYSLAPSLPGCVFPGGGAGVLVASGGTMCIRVVAQPEKIVLRCRAWQSASYSGLTLIARRQSSGGASRKREAIDLTAFKKGFIISFLC